MDPASEEFHCDSVDGFGTKVLDFVELTWCDRSLRPSFHFCRFVPGSRSFDISVNYWGFWCLVDSSIAVALVSANSYQYNLLFTLNIPELEKVS